MQDSIITRVILGIGAIIITVLSWVMTVALRAKSCAVEAKTETAVHGEAIDGLKESVRQLHADQTKGFARVHERLDKIING